MRLQGGLESLVHVKILPQKSQNLLYKYKNRQTNQYKKLPKITQKVTWTKLEKDKKNLS